jgi:hypothetical protein
MYLGIREVKSLSDYELLLVFENDEKKKFDMKPCLCRGIFRELSNEDLFKSVRISFDSIQWANNADLDPEFLYEHSVPYMA